MPLRAVDPITDRNIFAFDLSLDEWRLIEETNRRKRHLLLPCCSSPVVLRISPRGTKFFAHKVHGACATGPETETHLRLKQMVVTVARAHHWSAETEVLGTTPAGYKWKADVLAERDGRRKAIEIQWSGQTEQETLLRQSRYAASGVLGIWVFRKDGFPINRSVPAAQIGGNPQCGFTASIPTSSDPQVLPMEEFLSAVFTERLRFGVPMGVTAIVSVWAGTMFCWSCGAETPVLTSIQVQVGPHTFTFSVPDLTKYMNLVNTILAALPTGVSFVAVKRRFSRAQQRSYLSNGCVHCDALLGEHHEYNAYAGHEKICTYATTINQQWLDAIGVHQPLFAWGVHAPEPA